jgi:hypothetical protein
MQAAIRLNTSPGGRSSPDVPPPDRNEYNEEIYRYLTQLHQQQMQQRAQNSSNWEIPTHVQQALNVNTAFLQFSEKLVEGLTAQQIECIPCRQIHEDWLIESSSAEPQARVLGATNCLNEMVDAHVQHAETDPDEFCLAKLSVTATLGQLQASQRLQSRMEELVRILWRPREPFQSDDSTSNEMLHMEWKLVKNALKTLYHHYLFLLKRVQTVEDATNELDKDEFTMRVKREKERFDRTASLLCSETESRITFGKHSRANISTEPTETYKALESSSKSASPPHSDSWATDSRSDRDLGWETINISSSQSPKGFVTRNIVLEDTAKKTEEVCSRLLESLSNLSFNENLPPTSSVLLPFETDSSWSHDSHNQAEGAENPSLSQPQEIFTRLNQTWMSLMTGSAIDSNGGANAEKISQDGVEDAKEPSGQRKSGNGKRKETNGYEAPQSKAGPVRKRLGRNGDEQDDEDEDEDNEQQRKRQRFGLLKDPRGFACPYFKRDPDKHAGVRSCSSGRFADIHRLK